MFKQLKKRGRRPKVGWYMGVSDVHGEFLVYVANTQVECGLGLVNYIYTFRMPADDRVLGQADWVTTPFLITDQAWTLGYLVKAPIEPKIRNVVYSPIILSHLMRKDKGVRIFTDYYGNEIGEQEYYDVLDGTYFGHALGSILEEAAASGTGTYVVPKARMECASMDSTLNGTHGCS